jgi:hypothetical protein
MRSRSGDDGTGSITTGEARSAPLDPGVPARDRIQEDLARLGVADDVREEIARRFAPLSRRLSRDAYEAALAGVVLAHGVHRESEEVLRRSVRDLGEIQRLLTAFSDEMGKLDEALQILATYVKRMRSRARPPQRPRWLN